MLKELLKLCISARYTHTANGGDYAIRLNGDTIYVLFQHSNGALDWINNLDFLAKPFRSIRGLCSQAFAGKAEPYKHMNESWKCHRGFLRVWKAMQDEIVCIMNDLVDSECTKRIVCAGYSHGAAIALLATEDMAFRYGDSCTVEGYGFGGPRVLYGEVPDTVLDRLKRFTVIRNVPDLVTHLPPKAFGFKHTNVMEIGKKGMYGCIRAHYADAYLEQLQE